MNISEQGELFESLPLTYVAGTLTVDLRFLDGAKSMRAPVVDEVLFRFTGSVSGITGGHVGEDSFKIFRNISMVDKGGEFYAVPGSIARIDEQMEYESVQTDPAAIASGATNTSYDFFLRIPFRLMRALRPNDTSLELTRLTEQGQVQVSLGAPPAGVVNSGTVKMYCRVRDERNRELKSRLIRKVTAMIGTEYNYQIGSGGSLRKFVVTSDDTSAAAYTSLSSLTTIDSTDLLRVRNQDPVVLKEQYRGSKISPVSGDEILAANAIPVVFARQQQHIGAMPSLKTANLKLASTVTNGRILLHYIEDRSANTGVDWLGLQSPDQLQELVRTKGKVNSRGVGDQDVSNWSPELIRRMPVKF